MGLQSVDHDRKQILGLETARLLQRENPLCPATCFIACGSLRSLSPEHGKAQHPLCMIIAGSNSRASQKQPKSVHLPVEPLDKGAGLVRAMPVEGNQPDEAGIEGLPLTPTGLRPCHMAQALKLRQSPGPKAGNLGVLSLGELACLADQMGQAGLPLHPPAVEAAAVADQRRLPCDHLLCICLNL